MSVCMCIYIYIYIYTPTHTHNEFYDRNTLVFFGFFFSKIAILILTKVLEYDTRKNLVGEDTSPHPTKYI